MRAGLGSEPCTLFLSVPKGFPGIKKKKKNWQTFKNGNMTYRQCKNYLGYSSVNVYKMNTAV